MISRDELMHHRLQAWLRENKSNELEYLGFYPDILGVERHWYLIAGKHKVSVDCIEGLDLVEDESDSLCNVSALFVIKKSFYKSKVRLF